MGCVRSKKLVRVESDIRGSNKTHLKQASGVFTTVSDGRKHNGTLLGGRGSFNKKTMNSRGRISSKADFEEDVLILERKNTGRDLKSINEESNYEQQLTHKYDSSKYSFSKKPSMNISIYKEESRQSKQSRLIQNIQAITEDEPSVFKAFVRRCTTKLTFRKTNSNKYHKQYSAGGRSNSSYKINRSEKSKKSRRSSSFGEVVECREGDNITVRHLLSVASNRSDLLEQDFEEEDDEEHEGRSHTLISNMHSEHSMYHTHTSHPNTPKSPYTRFSFNTRMEESRTSFSSLAQAKRGHYLKIKFDVFDRNKFSNRKIFVLNLVKSLYMTAVYMSYMSYTKESKKESKKDFAWSSLKEHHYKNSFDLLNNHSKELESIFGDLTIPHAKEFVFQLYQVISNNIDVKMIPLTKMTNNDPSLDKKEDQYIYNKMYTVINEKYQILDQLSSDELYSTWTFHKCINLKTNIFFSVRIIDRNRQKEAGFRYYFTHELHVENRMVYSKYSLKVIEIISNNNYDYIISEYVDCSLYDWVLSRKNVFEGYENKSNLSDNTTIDASNIFNDYSKLSSDNSIIKNPIGSIDDLSLETVLWKLLRNFISALDYCHNSARIAHRNLNLKNIFLVKADISIRITDYSMSSFLDEDAEFLPCNRDLVGVFPSPEFEEDTVSGESADVWACGMILYYMIFKHYPCPPGSIPDIIVFPQESKEMDKNIIKLLKSMLKVPIFQRIDISSLKKNPWITQKQEYPLPNVNEDTIESIRKFLKIKINQSKFSHSLGDL